MSNRTLIRLAWISIILVAAYLRFHDLGDRPMHADEATGARIAATRMDTGKYLFNPVHYHGPTLSATTVAWSWITAETSWEDLSAISIRQVTAFFGLLTVAVPLLWIRIIGKGPALAAAALLATSPLLVYYSRMYIHESLLAFSGLLAITMAVSAWIEQKRIYWAIAGVCLGLMAATKETFAISIVAWCMAFTATAWILRNHFSLGTISREKWLTPVSWMLPIAALTTILLYTDGFRNLQALADMVRTFFVYETVPGHDKPFQYYFNMLILPQGSIRLFWWEGGIALLGVLTLFAAWWKRDSGAKPEQRFLVPFLAGSVIFHMLIYSLIHYKTPWLMVFPWIQACLLAAMLFTEFHRLKRSRKAVLISLMAGLLALQSWQCLAASGRFANDQRNPYAYVPTSADVPRLADWLVELGNAVSPQSLEPIAVVGQSYWPLPWYLRSFKEVGYWSTLEDSMTNLPVILVMPEQFGPAELALRSSHVALPRGLRQETPMILYLDKRIWEEWMKEDE